MSKGFKLDPLVYDELMHYGTKGMKWGVRKDRGSSRPEGVSRSTNRAAKKDATEFAKAKMFYGEGAGTRRKLIKAKVTQRSTSEEYKKAFDFHLDKQDMGKRADQARSERRRKDVAKGTAKTARGIKNLALQTGAPVAMSSLAIYAAYQDPRVRQVVNTTARTTYNAAVNSAAYRDVRNLFRN